MTGFDIDCFLVKQLWAQQLIALRAVDPWLLQDLAISSIKMKLPSLPETLMKWQLRLDDHGSFCLDLLSPSLFLSLHQIP